MKLDFLANQEEFIPTLAGWYFKEWGHLSDANSISCVTSKLEEYLNTNKLPLIVVAFDKEELLGAAQLRYREMTIYPEREHWLGGVYVSSAHRNNGLARDIVDKVIEIAQGMNVQELYLQTEDLKGGLYRKMGWRPTETVNYRNVDVLVMRKEISLI